MSATTALHRFGLGSRPDEAETIADPRDWLNAQVRLGAETPTTWAFPHAAAVVQASRAARAQGDEGRKAFLASGRASMQEEAAARMTLAATTNRPFVERLVRFWSNHLTVSAAKRAVAPFWGSFEREVVRPHVTGRFEDMLLASCRHPAMLLYLDQARSVGPDSVAGQRREAGLNENLAREILELHTLGVDGGYTQEDVIGLARILTGWTLGFQDGEAFSFAPRAHQPGSHRVLGSTWPEGEEGGIAVLTHLARHPATAKHIAGKLVRHLVGDEASDRAITHVASRWIRSGGDLAQVAEALVEVPDGWRRPFSRLRTPDDLVIATARAWGETDGATLRDRARALGMPGGEAPSPAGWPDHDDAWLGPESMLARLDLANTLAIQHRHTPDPVGLARSLFGEALSTSTAAALARSPSRRAIALLAASPEFQRR